MERKTRRKFAREYKAEVVRLFRTSVKTVVSRLLPSSARKGTIRSAKLAEAIGDRREEKSAWSSNHRGAR